MRSVAIRLVLYIENEKEYEKHQNCFFGIFGGKVIMITFFFGEKMLKVRLVHRGHLNLPRIPK